MSTYQEPILRFRVLKQLNDAERNPKGCWSLVYSTSDYGNAEEVAAEERETWGACGDKIKVVDSEKEVEYISRAIY